MTFLYYFPCVGCLSLFGLSFWLFPNNVFPDVVRGFLGGSDDKDSAYFAEDLGLIPWSVGSNSGNDFPLQYSCLVNPIDRGAWLATVHGVAKSLT